ncbi:hypothetical protein EVAR_2283_1 [Eumeta japonica]|uniref:Uncharacterized protein n=1 Tax=Eumeta variegata TaxID=151549 RepID=A0A4C1SG56_EUMVA|nr:hypothetical protein EVAR_2283_1 [Eumeta japonica]
MIDSASVRGAAGRWPSTLLLVGVLLCKTIVCDSLCPKFAEKPLETRVQDASIVFRAVVVQAHYEVSEFKRIHGVCVLLTRRVPRLGLRALAAAPISSCLESVRLYEIAGIFLPFDVADVNDRLRGISKTLDLALVSIYRGGMELASVSQYAGSPYNTTDRGLVSNIIPGVAMATADYQRISNSSRPRLGCR